MRAFGDLCISLLSITWKRLARGNRYTHAWQLATCTDELSTDKLSTNHGFCNQFLRKLSAAHDAVIKLLTE